MYTDADQFITDVLTALRGGDYPQAMGKLHRPEGFCCLGVMCDIYAKDSGEEYWIPLDERYYEFRDPETGDHEENGLPESIIELLGFTHGESLQELPIPKEIVYRHASEYIRNEIIPRDGYLFITSVNDEGCPFDKIADIIEDWWKERKETA